MTNPEVKLRFSQYSNSHHHIHKGRPVSVNVIKFYLLSWTQEETLGRILHGHHMGIISDTQYCAETGPKTLLDRSKNKSYHKRLAVLAM